MSNSLLACSIGPVQEFIAKARRTRDLRFGSWVLSEIAKAAAARLQELGAELVFPSPDTDLKPDSPSQVANKLLAIVAAQDGAGSDARCREVAEVAHQAAEKRWQAIAGETLRVVRDERHLAVVEERFQRQISTHLEWASAWVPLPEGGRGYAEARQRVEHLLAMRKTLRAFPGFPGEAGVPKSSLDGARETIFEKPDDPGQIAKRLRQGIRRGEQLCAIGLVKRFGAGHQPFPSVAHLAASPTIRGCDAYGDEEERKSLEVLAKAIQDLGEQESVMIMPEPWGRASGAMLFPERLAPEDRETEKGKKLVNARQEFTRLTGSPLPYYAILLGDGDHMGKAIAAMSSADEHRRLNTSLLRFCRSTEEIVEDHHGILVYAGGDDVLALLPVDTALSCSRKVRDAFVRETAQWKVPTPPSFSVGLAIVHAMDPLEGSLDRARAAEKAAKVGGRNALAVLLDKRSGAPLTVVGAWASQADDADDAAQIIAQYARLHLEDAIPDGAAYELRHLAHDPLEGLGEAWRLEIVRVLTRKRVAGGKKDLSVATRKVLLDALGQQPEAKQVEDLADRLILSRLFAEAIGRAEGLTLQSKKRGRRKSEKEAVA